MARPQKIGLDYFPLDTTWDRTMRLIEARFKLLGVGCIVTLYQDIYREGYALKWDDDAQALFSLAHGIDEGILSSIIAFAVEKGLFDRGLFESEGILTSRGIQKRWHRIVTDSHREVAAIPGVLSLIDSFPPTLSLQSSEETEFPTEETPVSDLLSPSETPQSKVKKSKEEKRREEEMPPVLKAWFTRYAKATTITRQPSTGEGSEWEAAVALTRDYDPDKLLGAVAFYFDHWTDFWFAVSDAIRRRPAQQKVPNYVFKAFASHIDEIVQAMSHPEASVEDVPF